MKSAVICLCVIFCLAGANDAADEGVPAPETLFKQLDTDGDGQLTAGEVPEDKRPLFDRLVRKADADKDGKLSLEEFQAAHQEDDGPRLPLEGDGRPDRGGGDFRQRLEMLDRNKDGKVTRDEVPGQARRFLAPLFDRLGKDALTLEDFRGIGQPGDDANAPSAESRGPALMRLLDANRDGRISQAEWAKAGEVFGRLDVNGDGELDPRELFGFSPEMTPPGAGRMERPEDRGRPGAVTPAQSRAFFDRLDSNKDGKLSKEEAPPRMRERFDRFDADNDGQVTAEELQQAFQPRNSGRARPKRPAAE
jgi:Ca2+-binding EF-hand superfamily protein